MVTVPQTQTVHRCVNETQQRQAYVLVPKTKTVTQTYRVCVPRYKTVTRTVPVTVPEVRPEVRQAPVTTYEQVPVVMSKQVVCYTPQTVVTPPTCGPCGMSCGAVATCMVPTVQTVNYTAMQCVPKTVM
jgi:hypothetical protein